MGLALDGAYGDAEDPCGLFLRQVGVEPQNDAGALAQRKRAHDPSQVERGVAVVARRWHWLGLGRRIAPLHEASPVTLPHEVDQGGPKVRRRGLLVAELLQVRPGADECLLREILSQVGVAGQQVRQPGQFGVPLSEQHGQRRLAPPGLVIVMLLRERSPLHRLGSLWSHAHESIAPDRS